MQQIKAACMVRNLLLVLLCANVENKSYSTLNFRNYSACCHTKSGLLLTFFFEFFQKNFLFSTSTGQLKPGFLAAKWRVFSEKKFAPLCDSYLKFPTSCRCNRNAHIMNDTLLWSHISQKYVNKGFMRNASNHRKLFTNEFCGGPAKSDWFSLNKRWTIMIHTMFILWKLRIFAWETVLSTLDCERIRIRDAREFWIYIEQSRGPRFFLSVWRHFVATPHFPSLSNFKRLQCIYSNVSFHKQCSKL